MNSMTACLMPMPRRLALSNDSMPMPQRIVVSAKGLEQKQEAEFQSLANRVLGSWIKRPGSRVLNITARLIGHGAPEFRRIPPGLRHEAYSIRLERASTLEAADMAGLKHGLQTLRQMLEDGDLKNALPRCRILDWPRLACRGIHIDLAREMEYRPEHIRRVVEILAYFRMNTLHLYLENKFVFPSAPDLAPPGVMTPDQARDLVRFAKHFGITVIPQIATMGHMEHLLNGSYAELREKPSDSFNICPSHKKTRPFLAGLIADVAAAFHSPFIHVGYDESHSGVCPRCQAMGTPQDILAHHLNWLNAEVKGHNARTMIYGDKFLSRDRFPRSDALNGGTTKQAAAALRRVGRDILITDWHYTAPYGGTFAALAQEGFETHLASATNIYWHDSIPLHAGHHWIAETIEQAVKQGVTGAFNCNWELDRGQFMDNFWFFQALAAERQWTDAPHDYAAFGARFSSRFWNAPTDRYSEIAGMAEATKIQRREQFLDAHPLTPLSGQSCFDYIEIGSRMEREASRLCKEAKRHADTLCLLDMPGLMIRYMGQRSLGATLANRALATGNGKAAVKAFADIADVAAEVKKRLAYGYKIYGGAVKDRERVQDHIDTLQRIIAKIRKMPASALKSTTTDSLLAEDREQAATNDPRGVLCSFEASALQPPIKDVRHAQLPPKGTAFFAVPFIEATKLADMRPVHAGRDGLVYLRTTVKRSSSGAGTLLYGADGPVKIWINGVEADCRPEATNPAIADQYTCKATWRKGDNTALFAVASNHGLAWGIIARAPRSKN